MASYEDFHVRPVINALGPHVGLAADDVVRELRKGDPAVAVGTKNGNVFVNPQELRPGEERIVAERLRAVLSRADADGV